MKCPSFHAEKMLSRISAFMEIKWDGRYKSVNNQMLVYGLLSRSKIKAIETSFVTTGKI